MRTILDRMWIVTISKILAIVQPLIQIPIGKWLLHAGVVTSSQLNWTSYHLQGAQNVLFGSSINPSSQQIKQLVRIISKCLWRFNRISRCEAKNSSLKTLKAQMALLKVLFFICRVLSQANREPQNSETYLWWACWTGWWCCWRADGQMEELAVDTDTTAATRILVE